MTDFAIVTTTLPSAAEAHDMARALVEARLAGCVQITAVTSIYRWAGAIAEAAVHQLTCKIAAGDFQAVDTAIRARHPYDVPEIVMTAITAGHTAYLDWLAAAVVR